MANVSFSQFNMFYSCPYQYKLTYIDKLSQPSSNIYFIFGTSIHETLQNYIEISLNKSKIIADNEINISNYFKERMKINYLKEKNSNLNVCTKEEYIEFLNDGINLLNWFIKDKNFNNYFSLKNDKLIAIEYPLNIKIKENINFIGFIDLIIKNEKTGRYKIIDFKTSTNGWSKYQKLDDIKNAQILLYKNFYSKTINIDIELIDVEFIILNRKLKNKAESFIPNNNINKIDESINDFLNFINIVFDNNGNYNLDLKYNKNITKLCNWCEFYKRKICNNEL